jgi:hypothetical protein
VRRKSKAPVGKSIKGWVLYEGDTVARLSDGANFILVGRQDNVMLIRQVLPATLLPAIFHTSSLPVYRVHPGELGIQSK